MTGRERERNPRNWVPQARGSDGSLLVSPGHLAVVGPEALKDQGQKWRSPWRVVGLWGPGAPGEREGNGRPGPAGPLGEKEQLH